MSAETGLQSSNSSRSKRATRVKAQTAMDAELHLAYEEGTFDYSTCVDLHSSSSGDVPPPAVTAYLQSMQRGGLIQSFGCMLAVDEKSLTVIAFSENASELLDLTSNDVLNVDNREVLAFGVDVRTLFQPSGARALQNAACFSEVNLLNPIMVHSKNSGKPFYAILHRSDLGLLIDLEPVSASDIPVTAVGPLKSYKLAAKPISKMQSFLGGNFSMLCDVLVKEVKELTGYDRVMIYKFHDDEHGEIVAERINPGLEPYLGLHYPATDVPQAARLLFMKNKVRMICDCLASPVKISQHESLPQPLNLSGSTLRAPHGCHVEYMYNMGSVASLVLSLTVRDDDDETVMENERPGGKLWGMVVCHHTSPRFVSFPLRYACKFLIQVFSIQVSKEVELSVQLREKHLLRTQTFLCDMILRDAPVSIVTESPSVMDLVKCDGAALYYKRKYWLLGVTPTEIQIRDLVEWLLENHAGSAGISTESLLEAGYPGASYLGNAVCGMTAVKINTKDFLFWFRSHTEKQIMWGGLRHNPREGDDGMKMHPRLSFMAFLEVVRYRSVPWESLEVDAIYSLQVILREALQGHVMDEYKTIHVVKEHAESLDELHVVTAEMAHLLETALVPIFAVDTSGCINGWNAKSAHLTGLAVEDAVGMHFSDLVTYDSIDTFKKMLTLALKGIEEKDVQIRIKTFGDQQQGDRVVLMVNACSSLDTNSTIVGVCFVGQDVTIEKFMEDKYTQIQGDYISIMSNPSALIPPIFMIDVNGRCLEWNHAMEQFSGLLKSETIGRMLVGDVFTAVGEYGCRVRNLDVLTRLRILQNSVLEGHRTGTKLLFGFSDRKGRYVEALLSASPRTSSGSMVDGVLFFLHVASPELQHTMQMQRVLELEALNFTNNLEITRHELKKALNGVKLLQDLLLDSCVMPDVEQNRLMKTRTLCLDQLTKVVDDTDIASMEECYMKVSTEEFILGEALEASISQLMSLSRARQVEIARNWPAEVSTLRVLGDCLRLQQVVANFLGSAISHTVAFERFSVAINVLAWKEDIGVLAHILHLEFRITHPAPGLPEELCKEMFERGDAISHEGFRLYLSQRLVRSMNGSVQYQMNPQHSAFVLRLELPLSE